MQRMARMGIATTLLLLSVPTYGQRQAWHRHQKQWEPVAMAKTTAWRGTTGDISLAANWTNGVPVATDIVLIPEDAFGPMNANMATYVGVQFAELHIDPTPHAIGTPGSPFEASANRVIWRGEGPMYWKDTGGTPTTVVIASQVPVTPDAKFYLLGTTTVNIHGKSGRLEIGNTGAVIASLTMSYSLDPSSDLSVVIVPSSDALTTLQMDAGTLLCQRPVTSARCNGGHLRQVGQAITNFVNAGCVVEYEHTAGASFVAMGGSTDFTTTLDDKTIDSLVEYPESTIIENTRTVFTARLRLNLDPPRWDD